MKRDLNKRGFIFEVIRRWSVNLIHRYSYLIFQFIVSVSLEKPDITYPSLSSSSRFSRATFQSYPEDLGPWWKCSFSVGVTKCCKYQQRYSLFMTRVENLFIYWPRRHNLGPGRQIQQIHRSGKPPGCNSAEHLGRVSSYKKEVTNFIAFIYIYIYIYIYTHMAVILIYINIVYTNKMKIVYANK